MDSLTHSLDLLNDTYNYNHWVYSLLRPRIGSAILEVGAGIGNLTQFLLHHDTVVCLEINPAYIEKLNTIRLVHQNVQVVNENLEKFCHNPEHAASFDTVICVNVLEHIKDDLAAVQGMISLLKQQGRLLLYVPACPAVYGAIDKGLGHFRRYSKRALLRCAKQSDVRVEICHYVNLPGLFGWFWEGRIKKASYINPGKARIMDAMVPYVAALERLIRPPVGQSLFASFVKEAG